MRGFKTLLRALSEETKNHHQEQQQPSPVARPEADDTDNSRTSFVDHNSEQRQGAQKWRQNTRREQAEAAAKADEERRRQEQAEAAGKDTEEQRALKLDLSQPLERPHHRIAYTTIAVLLLVGSVWLFLVNSTKVAESPKARSGKDLIPPTVSSAKTQGTIPHQPSAASDQVVGRSAVGTDEVAKTFARLGPRSAPVKSAQRRATPKQIRVGGIVQADRLISHPRPVYPPLARQARIQGTVRFNVVIGVDGTIQNLTLVTGHPLLVPAASEAVRQWRYEPTLLNGEPVEVVTQIDVKFMLSQ